MIRTNNNLVSIIIPTYNEIKNITLLLSGLEESLKDIPYEVVIVDDNSPDGCGKKAEELISHYPLTVVHRERRLGLASAVLKGFEVAGGDILGCMDADLSHPPEVIPRLIAAIREEGLDMAVASRLVEGGGVAGNWPQYRKINSYIATLLAKPLTPVKDSMSGCFLLKKDVIENVKLTPQGYKIGLEILVKGNCQKVKEVPFVFNNRVNGKSKMSFRIQMEYLVQIGHLYSYRLKKTMLNRRN